MAGREQTFTDKAIPSFGIPIQSSLWEMDFLINSYPCSPFGPRLAHLLRQLVQISLKMLGFYPLYCICRRRRQFDEVLDGFPRIRNLFSPNIRYPVMYLTGISIEFPHYSHPCPRTTTNHAPESDPLNAHLPCLALSLFLEQMTSHSEHPSNNVELRGLQILKCPRHLWYSPHHHHYYLLRKKT